MYNLQYLCTVGNSIFKNETPLFKGYLSQKFRKTKGGKKVGKRGWERGRKGRKMERREGGKELKTAIAH